MMVGLVAEMRKLTPYDFEAVLNKSNIQLKRAALNMILGWIGFCANNITDMTDRVSQENGVLSDTAPVRFLKA